MEAHARVGVLVERRAVEMRQAMRVDREMRGDPVEDDAEARRVGAIDEAREARRRRRSGGSARTGRSADSPRSRRADAR